MLIPTYNRNQPTRRAGQALLLVTLSVPVLFGLLGLVVDVGWMHFRQEMAQTAADAAAMAAVGKAIQNGNGSFVCGASQVGCQTRTLCSTSLPEHPTNSLDVACAYASTNGFTVTTGGRQFVYVTAGAASSPPRSPGVYSDYWVSVEVVETVPQVFSAILGNTLGTVSARSTAGVGYTTPASCVYVLDPSAASAFSADGGSTVNAGCGIFVNSSSAWKPSPPAATASSPPAPKPPSSNSQARIPKFSTSTASSSSPVLSMPA